jgi:hypothetical protein
MPSSGEPHGVTTQKTAFVTVTAAKTSNITFLKIFYSTAHFNTVIFIKLFYSATNVNTVTFLILLYSTANVNIVIFFKLLLHYKLLYNPANFPIVRHYLRHNASHYLLQHLQQNACHLFFFTPLHFRQF